MSEDAAGAIATQGSGAGKVLSGPQRVAALLMMLPEEDGKAIWSELSDDEIKRVCLAMGELGTVRSEAVIQVAEEFIDACAATPPLLGNLDRVGEMLAKVFPAERAASIMADVKGVDARRQVWRKLGEVPAPALAAFLRDEYPQTIAVVVARLGTEQGGRILALLPDEVAVDVIERVLKLGTAKPEALAAIEDMLFRRFVESGVPKPPPDGFEIMAERFDAFDRPTEARFFAALERQDKDLAQRIRDKMLTFDDLLKLDSAGIQTLMRVIDKDVLARALKGGKDEARAFFLANMSTRAGKNLQDDMEVLGQLRAREVDEAQGKIVILAKQLAGRGEIRIAKGRADEDLL
jgi:flagellar motor switch protein FliG